ncbi:MAG TPA: HNH endonuclease [Segetibacter sp.]
MSELSNILEVYNDTYTNPANVCIYCGKTENLTNEHIIPYGLNGRIIFPSSSCTDCNKITSLFEEKVLRGFMLDARTVGNFRTRRPKKRPKTISYKITQDKEGEMISIPSSEAPGFLHLPILAPCSLLNGTSPVAGVTILGNETILFGKSPQETAEKFGIKTLRQRVNFDLTAFVRMIAKIGYSFAVSQIGVFPFNESPVISLILGKSDDGSTWVGSADYRLPLEDKKPQHALGMDLYRSSDEELLVARVKLFADVGATGYEIVVRKRQIFV